MRAEVYYDDLGKDYRDEPIPEDMMEDAQMYREQLIEALADVDDGIMEKFMEGEEPTIEEMKAAIRKGTIDCSFFAVLCGTSYRNKGVQPCSTPSSTTCRLRWISRRSRASTRTPTRKRASGE